MSESPAVADDDVSDFRERVVGRRINSDTYDLYENWIRRFEVWRTGGEPDINDLIDFDSYLQNPDITDYAWENARGRPAPDEYAYSSRNVAISAVKLWVRLQYGVTIEEDSQHIIAGEPEPFDPHYLSRDDIHGVYDSAGEDCPLPGCEAALRLSYDAILRASELVLLEREDVDFDAGTVYVTATKGSQNAELSVTQDTLDTVREYVEANPGRAEGGLFKNSYGRRWTKKVWATHVRRKHHEAGAHAFSRHSPIVHRLEHPEWFPDMDEGDAFGQVFQRSRHSSPSMTSSYARVIGAEIPDWADDGDG